MNEEDREEKEEKVEEKKIEKEEKRDSKGEQSTLTDKVRENPWVAATVVLGIATLILLLGTFSNSMTGATIGVASSDEVQGKILQFLNSQVDEEVELVDINLKNGLYEIVVLYQGNEIPIYATADGMNLVQGVTSLDQLIQATEETNTQTQTTEVPKSDKPVVELFVMSYCPYGTQAEKGILPVFELLGDKIDSNIRFVYYAMHGDTEIYEQLNQYCIQTEQSDKYYDYLRCFLEDSNGERCLTEAGIDIDKLNDCTNKADEQFSVTENFNNEDSWLSGYYPLFDVDKGLNDQYGIGGSPSLVINGVVSSAGRDSASYLSAVCESFNTAPEECNEVLSSEAPAPGFGWDETAAADTSATCA